MRGQIEAPYPADRKSRVARAVSFAGPTVLGCAGELIVINDVEPVPLKFFLAATIVAGTVALVHKIDRRHSSDSFALAYDNEQNSSPRNLEVPKQVYGYRVDHSYSPLMLQELVGYSSATPSEPEN